MTYLFLLLPDFILIACGYLLCCFTSLKRQVWDQVEVLVYYFLFPVLLFHSVSRATLQWSTASSLITAGLTVLLCGIALSYGCARLPGVDSRAHASAAQIAFRFNSFVALAVASRFGPQALSMTAVLIGFSVPVCNIAAVWPMARHAQMHVGRELMRNPLIIATASGLLFNMLGLSLPQWSEVPMTRIGQAALVLGLLSAGAGMKFGELRAAKQIAVAVLSIRHVLMPLIAIALVLMFRLEPTEALVLTMFCAMPTASSCHVLASRMGYNGSYVAGLVTFSTLLGVASLTLAMSLLRALYPVP